MANINDYIGLLPSAELADESFRRIQTWSTSMSTNGLIRRCFRNYRLYHNADPYSQINSYWGDFGVSGENGEYMNVKVNHLRNIISHIMNMIFSKIPIPKSRAANSSASAIESVAVCDSILENLFNTRSGTALKHVRKSFELSMLMGTAYILMEWDKSAGEEYIKDQQGRTYFTGDLRVRSLGITDLYADTAIQDWEDVNGVTVRESINKYVLASQYPDLAEKILSRNTDDYLGRSFDMFDRNQTDEIYVYKYYHRKTEGLLPNGRFCYYVDRDTIMYDGENPYGKLPVFPIKPAEGLGTFYGYTPAFDLAPLQMFLDMTMSAIATNVSAHAVPNIVVESGSGIAVNNLVGGMNFIEVPNGVTPPATLDLMHTAPEVYELTKMIVNDMQLLSGMNSVIRGDPDASLRTATAVGIVQSMAVQFISGAQQNVIQAIVEMSDYAIEYYKNFSTTERVTSIVGVNKTTEVKKWKAEALKDIHDVYYEPVDPILQTIGGKMNLADNLLQHGAVNPNQYITVATTGQLEPMYQRPLAELNYIREENEKLMEGIPIQPLIFENHKLHMEEHSTLFFNTELRAKAADPQSPEYAILAAALQHYQEHDDMENQLTMQAQQMQMPPPQQQQGLPPAEQQVPQMQ